MLPLGRLVVLSTTAVALIGYAAWAGLLNDALSGPARWGLLVLALNLGVGLIAIATHRYHLARFFTGQTTAIALAGTAYGMIEAMTGLTLTSGSEALPQVIHGAGLALWSTFVGIVTYLWLRAGLAIYQENE